MLKAGNEYFFDEPVLIGNIMLDTVTSEKKTLKYISKKNKLKQITALTQAAKTNLQFFPEGGTLVYGLTSKVAFKAVGNDGIGKPVSGLVVDNNNQTITKFTTQHLGMGVFKLLPDSGKTYFAMITYTDSSQIKIPLPVPVKAGCVLQIDNSDSINLSIRFGTNSELINKTVNPSFYIVAQMGGKIYSILKTNAMDKSFTTYIPKNKFPSGIVQFTVFSENGEPLLERLVFIKHPPSINISIDSVKNIYNTREKVHVTLSAADTFKNPAIGNFSVSVVDENKIPFDENNEKTIFTNILLTSDLRGYIETPNYYFLPQNKNADADLDLLMLTQGYRRFEWKQLTDSALNEAPYEIEKGLQITGQATYQSNKPVKNGKITLLCPSDKTFTLEAITDENGRFIFKNLVFSDSTTFIIQAKTQKGKNNIYINLDTIYNNYAKNSKLIPLSLNKVTDSLAVYLEHSKQAYDQDIKYGLRRRVTHLKEVKIIYKQPLQNSSSLNGPGNAHQVILAKEILSRKMPTIGLSLEGHLKGVTVLFDDANNPHFFMHEDPEMMIYIDGVQSESYTLNSIPLYDFESIEVLDEGASSAMYNAPYGAILFNTRKGKFTITVPSTNIARFIPKGFSVIKQFYSPQYDNPKTNNQQIVDLRSTIYWNPNVASDTTGKTNFNYFNADGRGRYRMVIEGIDAVGNIGRFVYYYKVE